MIIRMQSFLNGQPVADPDCTNFNDTLLPGSNWVYIDYCCYVRRCKHDLTVHFKCGKRGNVPHFETVTEKLRKLIEETEEIA